MLECVCRGRLNERECRELCALHGQFSFLRRGVKMKGSVRVVQFNSRGLNLVMRGVSFLGF